MSLKQIPAVVSNVNRYLQRKTTPKKLEDFWVLRVSGKKQDQVWKVLNDFDKRNFQMVYNDIESNVYSLKDFATFVALYKVNTDTMFTGIYNQDDSKKIRNISALFDRNNYIVGVDKVHSILESSGISQTDFMKINTNGSSILYELFMAGEIDLAVAINLEPFIGSAKNESNEHIEFKKLLRILHAIRDGY